MKIGVYAGSLRPGGGLTVLIQILECMSSRGTNQVVVYTGTNDTSIELQSLIDRSDNISEKKFFHNYCTPVRYFFSKIYFLFLSKKSRPDVLFSINYFMMAFCPLVVYHLNLLNFQHLKYIDISTKIKQLDAILACRLASLNLFESKYLFEQAKKASHGKISNSKVLYIGISPEFSKATPPPFLTGQKEITKNSNLIMVSSIQPHKENEIGLQTLRLLKKEMPNDNWSLTIVGGQSIAQWDDLKKKAISLGIEGDVNFLGPISKKKLSLILAESLCLINPSRIESFCMVAVEAMSSNCPSIVVNSTSMPESVGDAAVIVEPGNPKLFKEEVMKFYNDSTYRDGYIKKGKEQAQKYSESKFCSCLYTYLND